MVRGTCWKLRRCSRWGKTEGVGRPAGKGRCSNRRTRQPDSASATPAASPASPPPITITFFKNILFRYAPETRLGDEYEFFRARETHAFTEDGKIQLFDAGEQGAISMHEEPQSRAAFLINEC